jgi:hypothetical protein
MGTESERGQTAIDMKEIGSMVSKLAKAYISGQVAIDMTEIGKTAIWMELVRFILLMEVNI